MKTKGIILMLMYVFCTAILTTIPAVPAIMEPEGANAELWVARYNGPDNGRDWPRALAVDGSGNVYVTGYSEVSGINQDYATIKYNSDGTEEWVARYNGPENRQDEAYALAVDDSGNVYVTGYSIGSGTSSDYATFKYDSEGNELWLARYNSSANLGDYAHALAIDGSGNVYVTGRSYGSGTSFDYATVKYDSEGNELWVARYNGPTSHHDRAWALAVDGSGNVYVTGESYGSGTSFDYATIKYNSDGTEAWVARYNGPGNGDDYAWGLAVDGSGDVYVTGLSYGSGTSFDYATVKYDSEGNELWVARYNGPANSMDRAWALAVDGSGNVYVTGYSEVSGINHDYATIKYNSDGTEEWVARYNGPENEVDWARAVAVDGSGNVYVTGYSAGSGTGDDYATIKYTSNGNELWVARYNGPGNGHDDAWALAVDGSGNVYVTGESRGSGTGYSDYATIKYRPVISPADFLAFYDENIADENLQGLGPGESSQHQENVIRETIVRMINLYGDGHIEGACQLLQVIYLKIDGEPNPSDFIGGDTVVMEEFRQHVLELLDAISCNA